MAYQYAKGHEFIEGSGRPQGSKTKNSQLRDLIRDFCIERFEIYCKVMDVMAIRALEEPGEGKNGPRLSEYTKEYREMLHYVVPAITAIQFETQDKLTDAQSHLRMLTGWDGRETDGIAEGARAPAVKTVRKAAGTVTKKKTETAEGVGAPAVKKKQQDKKK